MNIFLKLNCKLSYLNWHLPHLLEEEDDPLDHFGPLLLQAEQGARRADEDFGFAVRHVVFKPAAMQQLLHGVFVRRQVVVRPGEL